MNYSEAEFDKAYKKIIRRICKSKSPVNNPMAYILGGQPEQERQACREI